MVGPTELGVAVLLRGRLSRKLFIMRMKPMKNIKMYRRVPALHPRTRFVHGRTFVCSHTRRHISTVASHVRQDSGILIGFAERVGYKSNMKCIKKEF